MTQSGARSSEETIIAESFRDAERIMKDYLRDVVELTAEEVDGLYAFNTYTKERTSITVDNVMVDIDTLLTERIIARRSDGTEESFERQFNGPAAERTIPTFAEFEVVYKNPDASPEAKARADALISERDALLADMRLQPTRGLGSMSDKVRYYGIQGAEEIRDEMKRNHAKAA